MPSNWCQVYPDITLWCKQGSLRRIKEEKLVITVCGYSGLYDTAAVFTGIRSKRRRRWGSLLNCETLCGLFHYIPDCISLEMFSSTFPKIVRRHDTSVSKPHPYCIWCEHPMKSLNFPTSFESPQMLQTLQMLHCTIWFIFASHCTNYIHFKCRVSTQFASTVSCLVWTPHKNYLCADTVCTVDDFCSVKYTH